MALDTSPGDPTGTLAVGPYSGGVTTTGPAQTTSFSGSQEPLYPNPGMVPVMGGGRPLPDQTFTQYPSPNPPRSGDVIPGQDSGTPMNLPDYTGARVPGSTDTTNMFAPSGPNLPRRIPPVEYPATPGTAIRARKGAFGGRPPRRRGRRA